MQLHFIVNTEENVNKKFIKVWAHKFVNEHVSANDSLDKEYELWKVFQSLLQAKFYGKILRHYLQRRMRERLYGPMDKYKKLILNFETLEARLKMDFL